MDELNYNGFSNEENEIKSFGELNNTTGENVDANINGDVVENAAQYAAENIIENVDADVGENAAEGFGENVIENAAVGVADKRVENEKTYEGSFVDLKSASYYSESYTKPKKRKNSVLLQMILVAVMSSILGGSIVGGFFVFGVPALSPSVQSIFRNTNVQNGSNDATSGVDTDYYKKVVIENNADSSVVVAIAEKVGPSVVGISVKSTTSISDFWFFTPRDTESQGSGIIIRSDGYIMTNYHVIESALNGRTNTLLPNASINVILPSDPDTPHPATVVGTDSKTDLAVLKIEATNLPVIEFGDSDKIRVGELAVAIGNPGGLEYMGSVTVGVISGLNRTIPITDGKELKLIQTDAAINPGNSGGALVNAEGKLIGVNTAKIGGQGYEGLGFAIPVNKAKEITDSLIQYKYVRGRPSLGIQINSGYTKEIADRYGLPEGVLVYNVEIFSAAYKAGIQKDDIITEFNGVRVKNYDELEEQKNKYKPGDKVKLKIHRDGKDITVEVTLDEQK
ncbi:MAG TPA: PDZ domain-containing protein [Hungateiclostridium thermocellum]|uniref:Peptidase S1 and S6 chymotrypsin/Hap n=2 Tax=Acetivibrio thermocellus TaxID=1515 RepID=A3DEY9_ACET2|nr:trypsin-like peptidase domain-containing protein [Acetivibrio thermocellus]CDG35956.1 peptidase S1 and S6, chymotrypsin/Hap [Acetivibrio thermocellus BC1]ABN52518.1 peptidase S1 and S6 chymotrypsin/Hap [Acetivibrio thermocellus ATCC 27405]ADU74040.1 peptidase S1 and S6 chymotrypsin/Hap [Acetivibrio thermocellus DSM 1313]ALX07978.1 PDZ/DHR/GLGF domain protein [Acetivibrio thermocellus AD2]ANV75724.1 PDZ/DHR/GLGF domain protein [Acetivibrio thermocellus DSM 2360]